MGEDDKLEKQIAIRLSEEDVGRLDALAKRIPIASRNAIARAALRIGMAAIEEDPARILSADAPVRKPRKKGG
ncbi:hypothetical protein [Polyangium sp. 15x6]|uniref:hypothetical protein n=1 Tax=Polyangium sp. 15x6 TaxID=3042687 RepID=UPI00249C9DFA|nr:hypothetical protein [Polyangium sp. 15x6]MDI3291974.1 hypothetical protein [Polyangium sp. 15x6]